MPNDDVLASKYDPADQPRPKGMNRLRSMTVEDKFQELERLYAEGKKIKRTEEEKAAEEAEDDEVRERWNRLRRASLGEL